LLVVLLLVVDELEEEITILDGKITHSSSTRPLLSSLFSPLSLLPSTPHYAYTHTKDARSATRSSSSSSSSWPPSSTSRPALS